MGLMSFIPVVGPILDNVFGIIDKIIPDKDAAQTAKDELTKQVMSQEFQLQLGQIEINKAEAQHQSIFVAGWRPFIGWVCGVALAYHFLGYHLIAWALALAGKSTAAMPVLKTDYLFELVLAMLGMGGLRTYEKVKGAVK